MSLHSQQGSTTKMTTSKQFDYLNRFTSIGSVGTGSTPSVSSFAYSYNSANQRVRVDVGGTSPTYWLYEYDALGKRSLQMSKFCSA